LERHGPRQLHLVVIWPNQLTNPPATEPVPPRPIGTTRTRRALWIVDPFFMRAAQQSIGEHNRLYRVFLNEAQDFTKDPLV
jgi:hypothetical protein